MAKPWETEMNWNFLFFLHFYNSCQTNDVNPMQMCLVIKRCQNKPKSINITWLNVNCWRVRVKQTVNCCRDSDSKAFSLIFIYRPYATELWDFLRSEYYLHFYLPICRSGFSNGAFLLARHNYSTRVCTDL